MAFHDGIVTLRDPGKLFDGTSISGRCRREAPLRVSFSSEQAEGRARDQVALEVESVVNGSVRRREALS